MKQLFYALGLAILTVSLSVAVIAQEDSAQTDQFNKIAKLTKSKKAEDRAKAFELSKEFVGKYGSKPNDDQVKKIKEYIEKYPSETFDKKLNEGKTAEAFALGKEMLAAQPDNSYVTFQLAFAGFDAFLKNKDKTFSADSINYAKETLRLFEAGKLPASFAPFKDKNEATGLMYYVLGSFQVDGDLPNAAANFYKSVGYEAQFKTKSYPYYVIATYYEGKYQKGADAFKAKHGTKTDEDAEFKADNAALEKILANALDAYARAIKVGTTEKSDQTESWKKRFMEIYQFVNKSDAGAADYLANQPSKPFPDPAAN